MNNRGLGCLVKNYSLDTKSGQLELTFENSSGLDAAGADKSPADCTAEIDLNFLKVGKEAS